MFILTVNVFYKEYKDETERWNSLRISAIDGSKLSLPNDEPLIQYFRTIGAGNTSPKAQGSLLYDILNDVVDARLELVSTDERTIAEKNINQLTGMESFETLPRTIACNIKFHHNQKSNC